MSFLCLTTLFSWCKMNFGGRPCWTITQLSCSILRNIFRVTNQTAIQRDWQSRKLSQRKPLPPHPKLDQISKKFFSDRSWPWQTPDPLNIRHYCEFTSYKLPGRLFLFYLPSTERAKIKLRVYVAGVIEHEIKMQFRYFASLKYLISCLFCWKKDSHLTPS